jgi:hypothetical protein
MSVIDWLLGRKKKPAPLPPPYTANYSPRMGILEPDQRLPVGILEPEAPRLTPDQSRQPVSPNQPPSSRSPFVPENRHPSIKRPSVTDEGVFIGDDQPGGVTPINREGIPLGPAFPTGLLEPPDPLDNRVAGGTTGVSIDDMSEIGDILSKDETNMFLRGELAVQVDSTNVRYLKYYPNRHQLEVGFLAKGNRPESAYLYDGVTRNEALDFILRGSKGQAVWDLLRVRGSKTAHQKPYRRIE